MESRVDSRVGVKSNRENLIEEVEVKPRWEKDIGSSKSIGGKDIET